MITTQKEQKICDKYSIHDETGHTCCKICPLNKSTDSYDFRCKANSHYNKSSREWEYD
jgi:hypothetical protein